MSGVNLYMIARRARCPKSFSIRWHFQYRAADLEILKLLLPYPPQSWKQASLSAALTTPSSLLPPFLLIPISHLPLLKGICQKIFYRMEPALQGRRDPPVHVQWGRFAIHFKFTMSLSGKAHAALKQIGKILPFVSNCPQNCQLEEVEGGVVSQGGTYS